MASDAGELLLRLAAAGLIGACIGFEHRMHHKAIRGSKRVCERQVNPPEQIVVD